jgi:hypothetical protein
MLLTQVTRRVGINNVAPAFDLDVNGHINCTNLHVSRLVGTGTNGYIGLGTLTPSRHFDVAGDIGCNALYINGTKSFLIDHPTPSKKQEGFKLKHFCIESDRVDLQYRRTVTLEHTTQTFPLPAYFSDLTTDAICMCTPYKHFGSAWGEVQGNELTVHATTLGQWHLLVIAERNDPDVLKQDRRVEYIPEPLKEFQPEPVEHRMEMPTLSP